MTDGGPIEGVGRPCWPRFGVGKGRWIDGLMVLFLEGWMEGEGEEEGSP